MRHAWTVKAQPFVLIPLVLLFAWNLPFWFGLPLHLAGLFVSALVCHGELARLRPRAEHLTEFYFWLALGGALGGASTALLAPLLFTGVFEYPIALAAACLLRPRLAADSRRGILDFALPLAIAGLIAARGGALDLGLRDLGMLGMLLVYLPSAVALYALAERPRGFALGIAAALAVALLTADGHSVMARERTGHSASMRRDGASRSPTTIATDRSGSCSGHSVRGRAASAWSASASARSPATAGRDSAGPSTRSIR